MLGRTKWIALGLIFICCRQESKVITVLFELPENIKEASALEITNKSNDIWTLEDSGNKPKLYALDGRGKIAHTVLVTNAENFDWEELASDGDGNLYIGDFGNNENARRDLCIYKVDAKNLGKPETEYSQKISFYYPEQKEFPPQKSERYFDAEAFFYYKNNFYIFTKNRSKVNGNSSLYRIPAVEGNHAAVLVGIFPTCEGFHKCAITGADLSDDGTKMVLLSNRKVWVVDSFKGDDFLHGKIREIDLDNDSQMEGICFKGNKKVYLTDERDKSTGGKVYELKL